MGGPGQAEVLLPGRSDDTEHARHRVPGQPHPHAAAGAEGQGALLGHGGRLLQDPAGGGRAGPVPRLPGQHVHAGVGPGVHYHLRAGAQAGVSLLVQQHAQVGGGGRDGLAGGADHHGARRRGVAAPHDARPGRAQRPLQGQVQDDAGDHQAPADLRPDAGHFRADLRRRRFPGLLQGLRGLPAHLHPKQCPLVAFLSLLRRAAVSAGTERVPPPHSAGACRANGRRHRLHHHQPHGRGPGQGAGGGPLVSGGDLQAAAGGGGPRRRDQGAVGPHHLFHAHVGAHRGGLRDPQEAQPAGRPGPLQTLVDFDEEDKKPNAAFYLKAGAHYWLFLVSAKIILPKKRERGSKRLRSRYGIAKLKNKEK